MVPCDCQLVSLDGEWLPTGRCGAAVSVDAEVRSMTVSRSSSPASTASSVPPRRRAQRPSNGASAAPAGGRSAAAACAGATSKM